MKCTTKTSEGTELDVDICLFHMYSVLESLESNKPCGFGVNKLEEKANNTRIVCLASF